MYYQFPYIEHLDQVLPAINDRDEFIVARKDGYIVVNYAVAFEDTFPTVDVAGGSAKMREERSRNNAIRRECRGLIFDQNGQLISRRYHKFFNVNEREETNIAKLNIEESHIVLEKLDGSMLSPIVLNNQVRWCTKMGITDVAMVVEQFVEYNAVYNQLAMEMYDIGVTPIFEWCSNKNRIVIDHPQDQLILTAVRENYSGEYWNYEKLQNLANKYNIPVVQSHSSNANDAYNYVGSLENSEGVVVRFDNGHMIKIKSEWYVLRHKSKDAITREKNVVEYVINDQVDDVKSYLSSDDLDRLNQFQKKFWNGLQIQSNSYQSYFNEYVDGKMDRKTWAVEHLPRWKKTDPYMGTIVFGMFNGKPAKDTIVDIVKKNTGTQTKIDLVRPLWHGHTWNYSYEEDN